MYELYHHGIKGMRWGIRRYQNSDGSLTPAGIKRYAKAGYAQDSLKSNKSISGKAYDKLTGAHKIHADMMYERATKDANKARAERYATEKNAKAGYDKDPSKSKSNKSANKKKTVTGKTVVKTLSQASIGVGSAFIHNYLRSEGYSELSALYTATRFRRLADLI